MAINFPTSPTTGDIYTFGARQWRFDGSAWASVGFQSRLPTAQPSVPAAGDMYFDTTDKIAYVYTGTAWVPMTRAVLG